MSGAGKLTLLQRTVYPRYGAVGVSAPSFIRTIPSAPELHRIVRVGFRFKAFLYARGLYRRSGMSAALLALTLSPCPEGVLESAFADQTAIADQGVRLFKL